MKSSIFFDYSSCEAVDYLLPQLVDRLGIDKLKEAIHQAFDMQLMNGNNSTLPVLITETCGLALASAELLFLQTGTHPNRKGLVLLLSIKKNVFQIIGDL